MKTKNKNKSDDSLACMTIKLNRSIRLTQSYFYKILIRTNSIIGNLVASYKVDVND